MRDASWRDLPLHHSGSPTLLNLSFAVQVRQLRREKEPGLSQLVSLNRLRQSYEARAAAGGRGARVNPPTPGTNPGDLIRNERQHKKMWQSSSLHSMLFISKSKAFVQYCQKILTLFL